MSPVTDWKNQSALGNGQKRIGEKHIDGERTLKQRRGMDISETLHPLIAERTRQHLDFEPPKENEESYQKYLGRMAMPTVGDPIDYFVLTKKHFKGAKSISD